MQGTATGTGARILVADDEPAIRDMVATALEFAGFDALAVETGTDALAAVQSWRPDLVLLDVMLPDIDGFGVCSSLRRRGHDVPVIFLTARDADEDKVTGLEGGGDDYLTKPFGLHELVARIRAVLRRVAPAAPCRVLGCADLTIDLDAHVVTRAGREVQVSTTEFRLLEYLLRHAGRVVDKFRILEDVWGPEYAGDVGVVETYISYLRKKVDAVEPKLIKTVRGVGYSLREG